MTENLKFIFVVVRRQFLPSSVGTADPETGVTAEKAVNTPPPSDTMEIQDDRRFGAI
jgi:hypothetical protein